MVLKLPGELRGMDVVPLAPALEGLTLTFWFGLQFPRR